MPRHILNTSFALAVTLIRLAVACSSTEAAPPNPTTDADTARFSAVGGVAVHFWG